MLHIRVVKTGSGSQAVQIIYYRERKRLLFKHIGSAKSDQELNHLKEVAQDIINQHMPSLSLFDDNSYNNILYLNQSEFLGIYYTFLYEVLSSLITLLGFDKIKNKLLLDMVVLRIVEPSSKLRSIELLQTYFGIKHRRQSFYKSTTKWLKIKDDIETSTVNFAMLNYGFSFDILFYDVTTLYFETFEQDDLRKNGFSKDNKSQQPQILIALMVTKDGFPITYEIFPGNTFEGHTIIPVVNEFINKHSIKSFTVIADAAMISSSNIEKLLDNKINYIVGARLGNLSNKLVEQIDKELLREDGKNIRIKTENGYLICGYSNIRYKKDKHEMDNQIEKAELLVKTPSKNKKLKFIKSNGEDIELNNLLIEKTKKLLGIKGYYTNLEEEKVSNETIIERYHELYKVEQAFRVSKNDLQSRPIFHYKENPIKLHVVICFMALVISKHIEITTKDSIKKFITECKKVSDARMLNKLTNKEIRVRAKYNNKIIEYIKKLNLPH
jgi:transposase